MSNKSEMKFDRVGAYVCGIVARYNCFRNSSTTTLFLFSVNLAAQGTRCKPAKIAPFFKQLLNANSALPVHGRTYIIVPGFIKNAVKYL